MITAPIVARAIGPDGRGETAAAIGVFFLVGIGLALGVPLEVRRRVSIGTMQPVVRASRRLIGFMFLPATGVSAILYFTLFAGFEPPVRLVAAIGVVLTPLMSSWLTDNSVLLASGRYRAQLLLLVAQPATYLILVLVFWLSGMASTMTVLIANIAGNAITFLMGQILVRVSIFGEADNSWHLLKSGVRFSGSALAEAATNRLDQVLALPLLGAYNAGLYSVAVTIGGIPIAVGQALGASYFRPAAVAKEEQRRAIVGEGARAGAALAIVTCAVLAAIVPFGVPLLFGAEFAPAVPITLIYLIGSVFMVTAYVYSMLLAALGRGGAMSIAQLASLAVSTILLFALAPSLAAPGAALASTAGYITLIVFLAVALRLTLIEYLPKPRDLVNGLRSLLKGKG
ncbi:hypothetical protein N1027_01250 [Herbiconiux sp. CPCC 205763]|uniref:Polysaccharide biosynthesis protein C-terminal domain-containing protein n=1 Tax=Herbiconiux aconitum TaxID=2970913 RepID=A0ABT2GKK6_9MICO|nr:hypothetical protein [Herbiconiux aconitum]MCS5716756.1 hypothetical protein [Herbiconiux aconitum]